MKNLKKFKDEMTRIDSKRKTRKIKQKNQNKLTHDKRSNKSPLQYLNEEE